MAQSECLYNRPNVIKAVNVVAMSRVVRLLAQALKAVFVTPVLK